MDKPNKTEWEYAIRSLQRVARAKGNEAREHEEAACSSSNDVVVRAISGSASTAIRAQRDVLLKVIAYMAENDPPPDSAAILSAFDQQFVRKPCPTCGELLMIDHTVCFSAACLASRTDAAFIGPVAYPAPVKPKDDHGWCECGARLEHFTGPNAGGVLCPECDEEHVCELRALNEGASGLDDDDDDDDPHEADRCVDCHRVHCTDADDESCEEAKAEREESDREWSTL